MAFHLMKPRSFGFWKIVLQSQRAIAGTLMLNAASKYISQFKVVVCLCGIRLFLIIDVVQESASKLQLRLKIENSLYEAYFPDLI